MTDNHDVAAAMTKVLGNTYVLYVKTHGYHWNVTGPQFRSLHLLFEEQYRAMWTNLDEIAERIRALGSMAPGSSRALSEAASLDEADNDVPSAQGMLQNLIADHDRWTADAKRALEVASDANDVGSEDLLGTLIAAHEKMRWMLKSSLSD